MKAPKMKTIGVDFGGNHPARLKFREGPNAWNELRERIYKYAKQNELGEIKDITFGRPTVVQWRTE